MLSDHAAADPFILQNRAAGWPSRRSAVPPPRSTKRLLLSALMLVWLAALTCAQSPPQTKVKPLPAGESATFDIGGAEPDAYEVALNAGEFFQVRVAQLDVDVTLRLLDAGGNEAARMSTPRSYQNGLVLTFVAQASGDYRLEVAASDAKATPGKYTIRRESSRAGTAQDRRRVEVERTFAEGMTARDAAGQAATAIEKFTRALAGWQELGDAGMADITRLLVVQSRARAAFVEARRFLEKDLTEPNQQRALTKFQEASDLYHEGGEVEKEWTSLTGAAIAASNLKETGTVIDLLKRAYPLVSDPVNKADLLLEIVKQSISLGDDNTALEHLLLALPIYVKLGLQRETAVTAMTIGAYYYKFGDYDKALEFMNSALPSRNVLRDRCSEMELSVNLGATYLALDRKADAVRLLELDKGTPALVTNSEGCEAQKAVALSNLGKAYYTLGDYGLAINNYNAALDYSKAYDAIKADIYLDLGAAYFDSGQTADAEKSYNQALAFYKNASAQTKADLEVLSETQGMSPMEQLQKGLKLKLATGDKRGEARALTLLGEAYLKSDGRLAAATSEQALTLYKALNDRSGEAVALSDMMKAWRSLGNRRLAIFFGKLALNKIQELRGEARGIEIGTQKTYLRTFRNSYQQLAALLIDEGLFEQAVQVLNLYRDQEFFDLDPDTRVGQIYLSEREGDLARRYETEGEKLRRLEPQIAELRRRLGGGQPGDAESGRIAGLEAEYQKAEEAFGAALKDAAGELSKAAGGEEKDRRVGDVAEFCESLGRLGNAPGQKAVALYTLAADENFYVLLLTPGSVKVFSSTTGAGVVEGKVKDFRAVLSCPDFDPFKEAAALYDIIFKSVSTEDRKTTLEAELEKFKPDLLLWSLGDPLDGVPMAALYDAARKQFLVERYQHAVFTRMRPERISRPSKPWINGIGLGTAKRYTGYSAIEGVRQSLSEIFTNGRASGAGIINGPALIDEQFTLSALENLNGKWPLVHIATHFTYFVGDSEKSMLLLGDGHKLSLAEMQKHTNLFNGVELLVLSACETSAEGANRLGKEIDGLAELSQRLGAGSVIAALWNVYDRASPGREIAFYRLHRDHQNWAKSEVLRQSQLNLLHGVVGRGPRGAAGGAATGKGEDEEGCDAPDKPRKRFMPDPKAPFAHPYYWAPFVLYGSTQ